MHTAKQIAIFLISTGLLYTPARAQIVYKCGKSYSAQACPGGMVVNAADQRTKDQKDQADRATERDIRTAKTLESARLQQEAKDLAANTPSEQATRTMPKPDKKITPREKKVKAVRLKTPPAKKTHSPAKKTSGKKIVKP